MSSEVCSVKSGGFLPLYESRVALPREHSLINDGLSVNDERKMSVPCHALQRACAGFHVWVWSLLKCSAYVLLQLISDACPHYLQSFNSTRACVMQDEDESMMRGACSCRCQEQLRVGTCLPASMPKNFIDRASVSVLRCNELQERSQRLRIVNEMNGVKYRSRLCVSGSRTSMLSCSTCRVLGKDNEQCSDCYDALG
jgi:hypothetical protein